MKTETKKLNYEEIIKELKKEKKNSKNQTIKRIGGKKFQELLFALAVDSNAKATSHFFSAAGEVVKEKNVKKGLDDFLDKLLKKAGIKNEEERTQIIAAFEYRPKDIKFIQDLYEEGVYQVLEAGKTHSMFADKPMGLNLTKDVRKGKYEGQETIRRKINDRRKKLAKLLKK